MSIDLGGVTVQAVKLALDVAVLRHEAIANNIANAKTPDYQPLRVSFEERLRTAQTQLSGRTDEANLRANLERLAHQVANGSVIEPGDDGPVQLDREMVRLADNTLRYRALLQGLAKHTALLKMAIEDTRI